MTPKLGLIKLRRYAFVWRYDTTNRERENNGKNTVGPNELTDFEKFDVEHPETTKTIFTTNSPNHPGDGITLRQNRSSSHIIICKANAASNEIRVSEENTLKITPSDVTSVNIS